MTLRVEDLYYDYGRGAGVLGASFSAGRGEITAILGPNGSGKSTALRCIAGVLNCKGRVLLDGLKLSQSRSKKVAYLPQNIPVVFPLKVAEAVVMGRLSYSWRPGPADYMRARLALERVGLSGYEERLLTELSGGERQLAMLATLLTRDAEVLLLDEPLNNLDPKHQLAIIKLLRDITIKYNTITMITLHDLNMVSWYADNIILIHKGRVCCEGPPGEVLTPDNIKFIYEVDADVVPYRGRKIIIWK